MYTTGQTILARICGFAVVASMQGCLDSPVEKDPSRSPTGTPTLQTTKTPEANFKLILRLDDEGALSHSVEAVQHKVSEILGVNEKNVRVDAYYAISTECAITGVGINETANIFAAIFEVDRGAVLVDNTRRLANVSAYEQNVTVTITSEHTEKANSIYKAMETLGTAWSEKVPLGNLEKLMKTRVEVEMQVSIASAIGVLPDKDEIGNELVKKGIKATIIVVTSAPTEVPTKQPTASRTAKPTSLPTELPTATPSEAPTIEPTSAPTEVPTEQPTAVPTEVPTEQPTAVPVFKFYKFTSTRYRDSETVSVSSSNGFQVAEIGFKYRGKEVDTSKGSSSYGGNYGGGNPGWAFDGDINTKVCCSVHPVIFGFPTATPIDEFRFITGEDVPYRDPLQWRFEGSLDGDIWATLHHQITDFATPSARRESTQWFQLR